MTPIFQSELFFPFDENVGLIDGDVVSLDGTTAKFLCKSLDSPDSLNRLNLRKLFRWLDMDKIH